jgi:prolycopene isomerase
MQSSVKYDVAVIGSGMGSLTAAALLSQAGLHVHVFESQPQPGGYLSGFERNGFRFDTAVQWLNQCHPGGFIHRLFSSLGDDFPECRPLERISRTGGIGFDSLLTSAPLNLRDTLIHKFPMEEQGLRRFFSDAQALGEHWKKLDRHMRSSETMTHREKLIYAHGMMCWSLPIAKHLRISAEKGLDRYFKDPELRKLFTHQESFISMMMPVAWAFTGNFYAPPQGGSRAMVDWLSSKITDAGSEITLNRRVNCILLDQSNRAAGVVLDDGQAIEAQHVICGGDLRSLVDELLPTGMVSKRKQRAIRNADLYYSNFTVFLGLDCDPTLFGFGEEILYLVRSGIPRPDQYGGDPEKTALTILAPSIRDSSVAPSGKGVLTIHCPAMMSHHENWHAENGKVRGKAYRDFKQQFSETLIRRVEEDFAPGLSDHIETMEAATPLTYERYTGNANGTIMGTRPTRRNIHAGISSCRTPVKNLFLAGHWAHYSGGVPIAMQTGANTALLILKDCDPDAAQRLKNVMEKPVSV